MELEKDHEHAMHGDKISKRTLKTPFQLEILEEAFAKEKFPSQSMRIELSEQLGLTDKQLQAWFNHRRAKIRKGHEEQYLSSTNLHMKNEISSPNATISPAMHSTPSLASEVEDYAVVDRHELGQSSYMLDSNVQDEGSDTSPERDERDVAPYLSVSDEIGPSEVHLSAAFPYDVQDIPLSKGKKLQPILHTLETSMEDRKYNNSVLKEQRDLRPKKRRVKAAHKISLQALKEIQALAAMKDQLEEPMREDGPILGLYFDPLPPFAFECI
ncbi:hypothetical protein O6H91_07G050000 [Diphasiastrum complanatum]|uniref:Uncharacterized protein n=1 Tax=Diphasiastrum complanatum TaxID=34168 RepID=A0ACC2D535_DIPCM|nr:hypothetical protein O6H91_07G050000 [Diphasiastrum complanatum]